MRALAPACLVLALAIPIVARADALGGCPAGQIFQANPTQPGAMHHAGGQCVPDPSASHGCTVSVASRGGGPALALLLVGAAVLVRRRDKVRAR